VLRWFAKTSSDSGDGGILRSVNGRRRAALISEYILVLVRTKGGSVSYAYHRRLD
jgi:hypothetical protein